MKNFFLIILFAIFLSNNSLLASVDFNTASKAELVKIKGIGEKKAISIIEYRKSHKIKTIDELKNIKGFGDKLVSKIKENIK